MTRPATIIPQWQKYADQQYIDGLIAGDLDITHTFFYSMCAFTITDIRLSLFHGAIEFDEMVNELYIYLSSNDWHRLRTYASINGCSLRTWMVKLTWRFFLQASRRLMGYDSMPMPENSSDFGWSNDTLDREVAIDVETTLRAMPNPRYALVLRLLMIEGYDPKEVADQLVITVQNVYNMKHRAILQFISTYQQ